MTKADTIILFELVVNDITELSSSEESQLYDRVYNRICNKQPWVFMRKTASGTIVQDSEGWYIDLPDDFAFFLENDQWTDNAISPQNNAAPKVVYVINGTTYNPLQIVNWTDRRKYVNNNSIAFADFGQQKLRFPAQPVYLTYEFDYLGVPTTTPLNASPAMPSRFHEMIAYGMATENDVLQLSEKARSYQKENQALFDEYLLDLQYWNAQQVLD